MGLQHHQAHNQQQDESIGHQFQKADTVQEAHHTAERTAGGEAARLLRVPLGQPGGKVHDDGHLGDLRRLKGSDARYGDPPLHAVGTAGVDAGDEHRDEQQDSQPKGEDRQPAEGLVVDLRGDIHHGQASRGKEGLAEEVEGGAFVLLQVRRGVGGGKHHDHADAGEQEHQHQEGQVHGSPGQLLLNGQVALAFCQGAPLLSLNSGWITGP